MEIHIKCGHNIKRNSISGSVKCNRLTSLMIVRPRNINNFIKVLYFKNIKKFIYDCVTIYILFSSIATRKAAFKRKQYNNHHLLHISFELYIIFSKLAIVFRMSLPLILEK